MFSFHKPRVYRSTSGCCICRAKSSSSRFTDSRRYEEDFYACFKLGENRSGEICNACVLLVKRWKKLPKGSPRNWQHVVDARAGHGSKPLSKINKVKKTKLKVDKGLEGREAATNDVLKPIPLDMHDNMKKELYIPQLNRNRESSPSGFSDDVHLECLSSESGSYHSSLAASPVPSPGEVGDEENINSSRDDLKSGRNSKKSRKRQSTKSCLPLDNRSSISSFLDLSFWKREKTCCGIIFKGPCGEVILDRRFLNPCYCKSTPSSSLSSPIDAVPPMKSASMECFSIDSGYDDSSNSAIEAFRMLATVSSASSPNDAKGSKKMIMALSGCSYTALHHYD